MVVFEKRFLYGGAITVDLPKEYIDASDLRQVPSHQELYLSRTTLTSLIVEINARLHAPDSTAPATHFADPVDAADASSVASTTPVILGGHSLASFPAFLVAGSIMSADRGESVASEIKTWMLLVRLESKDTDLCVRLNVPMKEFKGEEGRVEEGLAKEVMEKIVESLEVVDWSLFVD